MSLVTRNGGDLAMLPAIYDLDSSHELFSQRNWHIPEKSLFIQWI